MSYYFKYLFLDENTLLESVGMGKAGYIKNANYFIKLAKEHGFTEIESHRSETTDSVYFMLKSPEGIIFQCRSSDHNKFYPIEENDIDTYIISKNTNPKLCEQIFNNLLNRNSNLPHLFKTFLTRMTLDFIEQYIKLSINNKLNGFEMNKLCKSKRIFIGKEDYIFTYFWFKKKLKEKVEQYLSYKSEYKKYINQIGILNWDEEKNNKFKW